LKYPKLNNLKKNNFTVVMYHHINEDINLFNSISFNEFKSQIDYLNKKFNILSPENFYDKFSKKTINKEDCILTFDDGYLSHYKYAFKYLKKKNLKAFFFPLINIKNKFGLHTVNKIQLILNLVKKKPDRLILIQNLLKKKRINLSKIVSTNILKKYRNSYYNENILHLRSSLQRILPISVRINLINEIYKTIVNQNFSNFYCKIDQLKEIKNFGNEIGAHTINHDWFSNLSYRDQSKEIDLSLTYLKKKKLIDNDRWSFAYPFGDYNLDSIKILRKKNCALSFLANDKIAIQNNSNLLINRIDCNKIFSL